MPPVTHDRHLEPYTFLLPFLGGGGSAVKIVSKSGSEKHFLEINLLNQVLWCWLRAVFHCIPCLFQ